MNAEQIKRFKQIFYILQNSFNLVKCLCWYSIEIPEKYNHLLKLIDKGIKYMNRKAPRREYVENLLREINQELQKIRGEKL